MSWTRTGAAAEKVAGLIEKKIAAEDLQAGHFLGRRQELVETFGVAPATLGEAIQLLRSKGLIEAKPGPGGGIFVGEASPFRNLSEELLDLTEDSVTLEDSLRVLDALDGMVLNEAIVNATDIDREDLRLLGEELKFVWDTPRQESKIWEIHSRIAVISPNVLLRSLYLNLISFIEKRYSQSTTAPKSPERLQTHLNFIRAVVQNDTELGVIAVAHHRKHANH